MNEKQDRYTGKPGDVTVTPPPERLECGGMVEKPLQTFQEW